MLIPAFTTYKLTNFLIRLVISLKLKKDDKSIAMVCRILWTGGVSLVAIEQQKALLLKGCKTDLYFLRNAGSVYEIPDRTKILHEDGEPKGVSRRILARLTKKFAGHRGEGATVDLDYIFASRKILKNYNQIIFHDQWSALLGVYYRIRGIKYVVQLHEFFRPPPSMNKHSLFAILAWIYDVMTILLAPAVVTTSEYNYSIVKKIKKNTFLVRIGFPKPVQNSVNEDRYQRKRRTVLSLTLWDRGRDPYFYADLAKSLPELDFIIAGSWTIQDEMLDFAEKTKRIKNIIVTGRIDEVEKARLLSSSHFYMRFGYNERGPGMGALEAMSYGLIPFANNGIGLSELIQDRRNGFLITAPLLENTISALRYANNLNSRQLKEMGEKNLDLCSLISWEANVKNLMDIFTEI